MWIAFGVAVAATLLSFGAFLVALLRENHTFSGLSALGVLVAGWTVIDTLVFNKPAALWVAGLILPLLTLRSLGRHETTIERVVHALEREPSAALEREPSAALEPSSRPSFRRPSGGSPTEALSVPHRSVWRSARGPTGSRTPGLALAGALVVLMSFALTASGHPHAAVRWVAFALGIPATGIALMALAERALPVGTLAPSTATTPAASLEPFYRPRAWRSRSR